MKRALTVVALLLACVACNGGTGGSTPTTGDIDQIESTLDAIESEMAGD
ncbi:hypothetical protein [Alloactinosynnema sp. L-07]|nr:hypothetical protein [Alloactinosynnema sp. L-07]